MRLLSGLLFVALTGSVTLADEAAPPPPEAKPAEAEGKPAETTPATKASKVPFRVVRMLPETHQVLLLHKNRGSHVVAEVGQDIDGYIVDEIDGDEVTLVAPSGAEIILTAPDMSWRRRAAERKAAASKAAKADAPAVDAAATVDASTAVPVDPYADEDPISMTPDGQIKVRVSSPGSSATNTGSTGSANTASAAGSRGPTAVPAVGAGVPTAPADPYASSDDGFAAFAEAVGAQAPAAEKPVHRPADAEVDAAGALAAAATGSPAPVANAFTVSRGEVDAALADFGATAVTFDAAFIADGLRIDAIAKGTLLDKAGLVKGDVITAVDGKPLKSFDDAADLYARLPGAKAATVVVRRAGKPVTLKVAIR